MGESLADIKQTVTVGDGQIIASKHETKHLPQDRSHQTSNEGRARVTTETQVDLMEKIVVTNDTLVGWPIRLSSVNVHEHEGQQIVTLDDARQEASQIKVNPEFSSKPGEANEAAVQPSLSMSVQVGSVFSHQLFNSTGFNIQTRVELRSTSPECNLMVQNVVGSFTFTADTEGSELPIPLGSTSEREDQLRSQERSATNSVVKPAEMEDSRTELSQSEKTIAESKLVVRTTENFENKHMHGTQIDHEGIGITQGEALSNGKEDSDLSQNRGEIEPPTETDQKHSCTADCACPSTQVELIGGQATVCEEPPQQVVQTEQKDIGPSGVTVDHVSVSNLEENIELKLGHLASAHSQESEPPESKFSGVIMQTTQTDNVDEREPVTDIVPNILTEHNPLVNQNDAFDEDKAEPLIVLSKVAEENKPVNGTEVEGAVNSERSITKDTPTVVESYPLEQIEEKPMSVSHSGLNVVDSGEEAVFSTKVDQSEQWAEQSVKSPTSEAFQQPVSATSPELLHMPEDEKQNLIQSPRVSETEQLPEVQQSRHLSDESVSGMSKSEEQLYHQVARRITNDVLQKTQKQTLQQIEGLIEEDDAPAKNLMVESFTAEIPDNYAPSADLQSTAAPVLAAQQNARREEDLDLVPKTEKMKTLSDVDFSRQSPMLRDAEVNTGRELSPETDDEVNNESEWSHSMHHYRHHHRHYHAGSGGERTHHSGFSPPCCGARKEAQSHRVVCHFGHGKGKSHKSNRVPHSCTQLRGQEIALCGCSRCCGLAVPYETGVRQRVAEDHSDDTSSTTQTASETSEMQRMTMTLLSTIATTAELLRKQYKKRKMQNAKVAGKHSRQMEKGEPTGIVRNTHQTDLEDDEIHGLQNTSCAEPYSFHEFVQNFRITIPAELFSIRKNKKVAGCLGSIREHGIQCDLTAQSHLPADKPNGLDSRLKHINIRENKTHQSRARRQNQEVVDHEHGERRCLEVEAHGQGSLERGRRAKRKSEDRRGHSVSGSILTCTIQEIAEEELSPMLTTVDYCLDATQNSQLDKSHSSMFIGKSKSPTELHDTAASVEFGKMSSEDLLHYGMEVRSPITPSMVMDHLCPSQSSSPSYDTSYVTPSIQSTVNQCFLGVHENDLSRKGLASVSNSVYLWCAGEGRHEQMTSVPFKHECSKPNLSDDHETPLKGTYSEPAWSDCVSVRNHTGQHPTPRHKVNANTGSINIANESDFSNPDHIRGDQTPMTISLSMQANWTKEDTNGARHNRIMEFGHCSEMHDSMHSSGFATRYDQHPSDREVSNSWAALTTDTADLIRQTVQCRLNL